MHSGPTLFESPDGDLGYSWTNGTTGGAAYATAVGDFAPLEFPTVA